MPSDLYQQPVVVVANPQHPARPDWFLIVVSTFSSTVTYGILKNHYIGLSAVGPQPKLNMMLFDHLIFS
jgi:hypothetical protein